MPIFEYSCEQCGHRFERIVFGKAVEPPCPKCASSSVEKLFSAFAVAEGRPRDGVSSRPACGTQGCCPAFDE